MKISNKTNEEWLNNRNDLEMQINQLQNKIIELSQINNKLNAEANYHQSLPSLNDYDYLIQINNKMKENLGLKK